jgi:hypothetical protein
LDQQWPPDPEKSLVAYRPDQVAPGCVQPVSRRRFKRMVTCAVELNDIGAWLDVASGISFEEGWLHLLTVPTAPKLPVACIQKHMAHELANPSSTSGTMDISFETVSKYPSGLSASPLSHVDCPLC